MRSTILSLPLLIILNFTFSYASAQKATLKYNPSIECDKLPNRDTVQFYYDDHSGNPDSIVFPVNSSISFKTELGDYILHSTSSELSNDSLIVYLTKQSFGLTINVKLYIVNNKLSTEINYWTVLESTTRRLKPEKAVLNLKNKELGTGDSLIGEVTIKFSGTLLNEYTMAPENIKGEINGCFNIQINKLFKER